jgi:hypothetical protein
MNNSFFLKHYFLLFSFFFIILSNTFIFADNINSTDTPLTDFFKKNISSLKINDSVTYTSKAEHNYATFDTKYTITVKNIKNNHATFETIKIITAKMPVGRDNKNSTNGFGKYTDFTKKLIIFDIAGGTWEEKGKTYINKTRVPFYNKNGIISLKKTREIFPYAMMNKVGTQIITTPIKTFISDYYSDSNENAWINLSIPLNNTVKFSNQGMIFLLKKFKKGNNIDS